MPTDLVAVLHINPKLASGIEHVYAMGGWREFENGERRTSYNWNMDAASASALMEMVGSGAFPTTIYSSHVISPTFARGSIRSSNAPKVIDLLTNSVAPGLWTFVYFHRD